MAQPMTRGEVAAQFVRAGYVVIYQDCRGRYDSEGEFTKYLSEGPDGYDTCAWIVEQPWCDGKIGTMGLSYAAHTQAALACLNPPGLACMVLDSGGFSSAYRTGIRQGGAFELKQLTWAYNNAKESPEAKSRSARLARPRGRGHQGLVHRDALVGRALAGALGAGIRGLCPRAMASRDIRGFLEEGRHLRRGLLRQFPGNADRADVELVRCLCSHDASTTTRASPAAASARFALIMGPGLHGNRNSHLRGRRASSATRATLAATSRRAGSNSGRRWFDRWLKAPHERRRGRAAGAAVPHGRRQRDARTKRAGSIMVGAGSKRRLAAAGDRVARPSTSMPTAASPRSSPRADAAPLTYDFDPSDPVPTIGGALTSGQPVFEGGAFDQREATGFFGCRNPGLPLSARRDVLSFETRAARRGHGGDRADRGGAWVSSDAPDTDFTAKLIDVHPPSEDYPTGFAMILTDGIFRCRYRNSWEKPEPIAPGRAVPDHDRALRDGELVQEGPPHPARHLLVQLPEIRREPEHRCARGTGRTRRDRAEHGVLRRGRGPRGSILPALDTALLTPLNRSESEGE